MAKKIKTLKQISLFEKPKSTYCRSYFPPVTPGTTIIQFNMEELNDSYEERERLYHIPESEAKRYRSEMKIKERCFPLIPRDFSESSRAKKTRIMFGEETREVTRDELIRDINRAYKEADLPRNSFPNDENKVSLYNLKQIWERITELVNYEITGRYYSQRH